MLVRPESPIHQLIGVWIFLYICTGALSPTIIDYLGHKHEGGDVLSFFPALSSALGLWAVEPFNRVLEAVTHLHSRPSLPLPAPPTFSLTRELIALAMFDLASTTLVTVGLVHIGSGTYTVIYSSAAAWTALIGRWRGHYLSRMQWIGVATVTLGLFLNGAGHALEDETRSDGLRFGLSAAALLIGTMCHSMVMVLIDEHAKESRHRALNLASNLGRVEVALLALWNCVRSFLGFPVNLTLQAFLLYLLLTCNLSFHSLAFFSMIGRLGAVGAAVLKGFLALIVFGLAAGLFCSAEHPEQCLTPLKLCSIGLVSLGGFVFAVAAKPGKQQSQHV